MKNLYKSILISAFICIFSQSFAQSVGDFGSLGTGNWGTTNANWRQWDGAGWNTTPAGVPTTSDNVYIRSGHTVTVEATGKNCANLTVETGAQLLSNVSFGRQINVYGSIICNGQIGNGTENYGIGFRLYAATCSISGNGVFDANYIQKGYTTNATTNLTIAMNVNLRNSDALFNSSATAIVATLFNITIASGVTLDFPTNGGSIGIDGGSSSTPGIYENGGTITVNGTLNLATGAGGLYLQTDNVSSQVGLVIGNGGIVNADYIDLSSTGSILPSVTVANNGLLNLSQSGNCPSGQSTIDLQSGSTVEYHGNGSQLINGWNYYNLKIGGFYGGTKTLEGNITVNGKLTLMKSGTMASGGYSLTYGASASLEYLGSHTTSDVEWPATFSKDITINSISTVTLNGSKSAYSGTLTFNGGTFDVGAYELTGTGAFLMSGSTKILTSHGNGIGTTGNFKLSGTQTFSATGGYEFNSSSSNQSTGNSLPATIGNLGINNTFSGGNVYLSNNISITGYLYRYDGALNLNGKTLTYAPGSQLSIGHGGVGAGDMTLGDEFLSTMDIPVAVTNWSGIKFILNKNLTLNSTLTLGGIIDIVSYNLTLGSSATIGGTPSRTAMIYSSSTGELRKTFASNGAFTFPIGDNSGTAEYSPCYINLTADAYLSAYVGVKVANSKYSSNTSSTDYLNRYWTLSSSGLTNPNYSAEFTYVNADISGTESNLYGGKYNGSVWSSLGAVDALNNKVTASGQTSFSDFTAGESGALPVELSSFSLSYSGGLVTLNWETANEVNNYGFEIERQVSSKQSVGGNWDKIGFVNGNGNSNSPKDYSFTDEPKGGKEFKYRLKQIDFDGMFEYSEEVVAVLENVTAFKLEQNYPNPFNPTTTIKFSVPPVGRNGISTYMVVLKVYDVLGREVATLVNEEKSPGNYEVKFDAETLHGASLPSGVYFYRLSTPKFTSVKKLLLMK